MKYVPRGVAEAPGDGIMVFNNTVVLHDSYFLERTSGHPLKMRNFRFFNNIFVTQPLYREYAIQKDTGTDFDFSNNIYAPPRQVKILAGQIIAGQDGFALDNSHKIGFLDISRNRFELQKDSPAIGAGIQVEGEGAAHTDLGAISYGTSWISPLVGPQIRTSE